MEQHIQGGEREGEQKDKKEWPRSQGDATTSFLYNCQGKATGTWQCLWPLVSSPSSCCASNLPQAGSVVTKPTGKN
jgi:hypothetical protein